MITSKSKAEDWLRSASRGLCNEAKERIATEIWDHYRVAVFAPGRDPPVQYRKVA